MAHVGSKTYPLLRSFLTELSVEVSGSKTVTYNGEAQSLTPTLTLPKDYDEDLLLGSATVSKISGTNAGT